MNPAEPTQPETPQLHQPVAYDSEGRPLYAHPPQQEPAHPQPVQPVPVAPTVVHVARPLEPQKQEVSPDAKKKHDRSVRLYPMLNLSDGEYVIAAVRRHPIGLIIPLAVGTFIIAMDLTVLSSYSELSERLQLNGALAEPALVVVPLLLFTIIVALGMFIVYYVYTRNKFFLTNESVIQEIQVTLFARKEQTVSLGNIEDASFTQSNIIQHIFDYGDIRLSTEGDETTYRFSYVAHPKGHIARLNNAVEAFKNGRPVSDD